MPNRFREDVVPEQKQYSLVEISLSEPVEDAAIKIREFDSLADVTVPGDTDFELYVVYNPQGEEITDQARSG